jgi:hypothetical protein
MSGNFRSQAFPKEGVEGTLGYAKRSFPDVLDLALDFSVMTLDKGPEDDTKAVLVLGDKGEALGPYGAQEEGNLEGLLWEVALLIRSRNRGMLREHIQPG